MLESLSILDAHLSLNVVIWLFPLAFFLHDLEEILTTNRFPFLYEQRIPRFMRSITKLSMLQFTIAVVIEFLVIVFSCYLASLPGRQIEFLATALAMFLVHAVGHVGASVILRRYTFGMGTALLIVLPYSCYAFYRLVQVNLLNTDNLISAFLIGTLLVAPFILVVRFLGKFTGRYGIQK